MFGTWLFCKNLSTVWFDSTRQVNNQLRFLISQLLNRMVCIRAPIIAVISATLDDTRSQPRPSMLREPTHFFRTAQFHSWNLCRLCFYIAPSTSTQFLLKLIYLNTCCSLFPFRWNLDILNVRVRPEKCEGFFTCEWCGHIRLHWKTISKLQSKCRTAALRWFQKDAHLLLLFIKKKISQLSLCHGVIQTLIS